MGFGSHLFLRIMNIGHKKISQWGLSNLDINPTDIILDVGCGGGKNIQRMLKIAQKVNGIDFSNSSVNVSTKLNKKAVREKRSEILLASAEKIPFSDGSFDLVTAFETVYFWPDFVENFKEVKRVLKPKGRFFVCNALNPDEGLSKMKFWIDLMDLEKASKTDYALVMEEAGFINISKHSHEKIGIAITGTKEE
jgi:ubiquinone/menaquinone biosynthesis C-methylase UbiE